MGLQRVLQAAAVASCLLSPALGGRFSDVRTNQEKRHSEEITKRHTQHKHEKRQDPTSGFRYYNNDTQCKLGLF